MISRTAFEYVGVLQPRLRRVGVRLGFTTAWPYPIRRAHFLIPSLFPEVDVTVGFEHYEQERPDTLPKVFWPFCLCGGLLLGCCSFFALASPIRGRLSGDDHFDASVKKSRPDAELPQVVKFRA